VYLISSILTIWFNHFCLYCDNLFWLGLCQYLKYLHFFHGLINFILLLVCLVNFSSVLFLVSLYIHWFQCSDFRATNCLLIYVYSCNRRLHGYHTSCLVTRLCYVFRLLTLLDFKSTAHRLYLSFWLRNIFSYYGKKVLVPHVTYLFVIGLLYYYYYCYCFWSNFMH
jgi:hypothetical protein